MINLGITPIEIWLGIGIIFILLEFTAVPGIGFLFVGFGAILSSIIYYYYPLLQQYQITTLGFSTLTCFLILWWPLKTFISTKNQDKGKEYSDIIGRQVEVALKDIAPKSTGQVYWSGTIMNAQLAKDEEIAPVGSKLYIIGISGNILICSRSKPN